MVADVKAARRPSPTGLRRFLDLAQQRDWMRGEAVPRDAGAREACAVEALQRPLHHNTLPPR